MSKPLGNRSQPVLSKGAGAFVLHDARDLALKAVRSYLKKVLPKRDDRKLLR
jgi:hypothetical protein